MSFHRPNHASPTAIPGYNPGVSVRLYDPEGHGMDAAPQQPPALGVGLPTPPEQTVADLVEAYLAHRRRRVDRDGYSARALEDVERRLKNFVQHFGDKSITACKRHDVTVWLDANPQWQAGDTINNALATLLACFGWAADEDLIASNPYKNLRGMKRPRGHRRPASVSEYVTLMRHGSRPLRRAMFFMRRSGARTGEMRGVRWGDVHWDVATDKQGKPITVIALYKHKTARKTGKPRLIAVEPCLERFLRNLKRQREAAALLAELGDRNRNKGAQSDDGSSNPPQRPASRGVSAIADEPIFTNCDGQAWGEDPHVFARHFRRTADRLGLDRKVSGYCLRHSFGTWAIEGGSPIKEVCDLMGHASTNTTEGYLSTLRANAHYLHAAAIGALKRRKGTAGPRQEELFDSELPFTD